MDSDYATTQIAHELREISKSLKSISRSLELLGHPECSLIPQKMTRDEAWVKYLKTQHVEKLRYVGKELRKTDKQGLVARILNAVRIERRGFAPITNIHEWDRSKHGDDWIRERNLHDFKILLDTGEIGNIRNLGNRAGVFARKLFEAFEREAEESGEKERAIISILESEAKR